MTVEIAILCNSIDLHPKVSCTCFIERVTRLSIRQFWASLSLANLQKDIYNQQHNPWKFDKKNMLLLRWSYSPMYGCIQTLLDGRG